MAKLKLSLLLLCFVVSSSNTARGDTIADAMMATYKLSNKNSTATCFVISRRSKLEKGESEMILVTAAHVLEKMSGDECRIVARKEREDGSFTREELSFKIRTDNQKLWVRHPRVDVAALKLPAAVADSVVALGFHQLAKETDLKRLRFSASTDVWIPGFPAQLESSKGGFPVLRPGSVASFPVIPVRSSETYLLSSNTFGGDSGAPVMFRSAKTEHKTEQLTVVGLIIGQHRETTKTVSPLEERTFHRPLGLAIVVHSEFVRETVDLIRRPPE